MKKRAMTFVLPLMVPVVLLLGPACFFSGDTARVTINVGKPPALASHMQHRPGIFSKLLSFITFSSTAHADPAPVDWYEIFLTVTGEGMNPLNTRIPWDTGATTITVPLGKKTFTVVVEGDGVRILGAIKTITVSSATMIDMNLGNLPSYPDIWVDVTGPTSALIQVSEWPSQKVAIYKSNAETGPYSRIGIVTQGISETLIDNYVVQGNTYWYMGAGINEYGEGEPSVPLEYVHDW